MIKLQISYYAKLQEVIEKQSLPEQIQSVMGKEKIAVDISTYEDLKRFLLQ